MRQSFPAVPESIPAAREALEPLQGELPEAAWRDLQLLVSELVTNAVRHADVGASAQVTLLAEQRGDHVRVEVHDQGPGVDPADLTGPATDGTSGWGLHLVAKVSRAWGVEPAPDAHVWFELRAA